MVYYEIKKVFSKASSKIALLFLVVVMGMTISTAFKDVFYVNEEGNNEYGISAVRKLKAMKKEWAGELTEEKLKAAIEEKARINATPEAQSEDIGQENIAYSWEQGLDDIRMMMAYSYGGFWQWDYWTIDYLQPEDVRYFYPNRIKFLKEWLDSEEADRLSGKEKDFLLTQYEKMEAPLKYDDFTGWDEASYGAPMIIMIMCLVFGFLVSGIFSGETRLKADSIFFSAYHGRRQAVLAKVVAGFVIVTGIYWLVMLLYSVIVLGVFGTDGADCMIQISLWKSFYNITFLQEYLLILFGGYIGTLFIILFTMLVSARSKSAVAAVVVPFIIVFFIPSFFGQSKVYMLQKILDILPDQLIMMEKSFKNFKLVEMGGKVTGTLNVLFPLYAALSVILGPVIYQVYRRTEVK